MPEVCDTAPAAGAASSRGSRPCGSELETGWERWPPQGWLGPDLGARRNDTEGWVPVLAVPGAESLSLVSWQGDWK